jgi:hypothetical protein
MNACIASYYMPNIDKKTVDLQAAVVKKFNKTKLPHFIMKGEMPHGIFMDYFWTISGEKVHTINVDIPKTMMFDYILFLDIDCIPVSENAIDYYVSKAFEGMLIGNAQRSGHINNGNHLFAAPSAVALSRESFVKMDKPSALETSRGDVAEEYTYEAERVGIKVEMISPTRYDRDVYRYDWEQDRRPYWTLEHGLPNYGLGTTYGNEEIGDMFWHNFQIRVPGQQEHFWKKCEDLLNG